jgi:hypothetical protein
VAVKNRILAGCAAMYLERMSACSDAVQRVTGAVLCPMMWWCEEGCMPNFEQLLVNLEHIMSRCDAQARKDALTAH